MKTATKTKLTSFDVMAQDRGHDRASFVRIAEAISDIYLPTAMTARGEKLMDDIGHELHELENSIFERIQTADWDEAHKINADIDIDRAAMAEALKPDKEKLIELVKSIEAIKLPDLKTSQAHSVAVLAIKHLETTACILEANINNL